MTNQKKKLTKVTLQENLSHLDKALKTFNLSFELCQKIGTKKEYTLDELDRFEALTSRFARISDIFTQKVLKYIFILLKENPKTFIDQCHLAEKLEIINSSDEILEIRETRNEIAHEYNAEDMNIIFKDVLRHCPVLIENINQSKKFILKNKL